MFFFFKEIRWLTWNMLKSQDDKLCIFHFPLQSINKHFVLYKYIFVLYFILLFFIFWKPYCFFLLEFNLPTYSITPSAHPAKCPPHCPSSSDPNAPPTSPLPLPLVHFPELGVSHVLSPSLIFSLIFSPFPFILFHYFLYSPNE